MLAGELTGRPTGLGNPCPSFMLKLKQSNLIGSRLSFKCASLEVSLTIRME